MKSASIRVTKFRLSKVRLEKLSDADRELFFLAGHILNELNSLNNVVAWCLRTGESAESEIGRIARGAQAMIYARILAGKVLEAWKVLGSTWFAHELTPSFRRELNEESVAALSAIKKYFGRANLIFTVRNSFAFHYSASEMSRHWKEVADSDYLQLVLGGAISNNINLGSEVLVNVSVIKAAHRTNLEKGMERFLTEVQSMASHFTTFFEGVTLVILSEMLGGRLAGNGVVEEISLDTHYRDVNIPYFCLQDVRD